MIEPEILQAIRDEAKKAAEDVYNQKGNQFGVNQTPTHSHNGVDSPILPTTSVGGFLPLPATIGGVVSPDILVNQSIVQGPSYRGYGYLSGTSQTVFPVYPIPVIYGHGVGDDSEFNGGKAPAGTVIFFENGPTIAGLWVNIDGTTWRGTAGSIFTRTA